MNAIAMYQKGFQDGFNLAQEMRARETQPEKRPEPETELPDLGEGMPSDEEMLLYATPFFKSEAEKKEAAEKDDQEEDEK